MSNILSRVEKYLYKKRVPFSVIMEITKKCNLDCVHCYVDHSNSELNVENIVDFQKKVISQINDMGVFSISFSGGEFFTISYWRELVNYTRSLGLGVKILTNGILITEDIAIFLAQVGVLELDISIYSHKKEIHDSITQQKNSYENTLESIKLLKKHGVSVVMKTPIMKQNYNDVLGIYQLALDLDVFPYFDLTITPAQNGARNPLQYALSESEIELLLSSKEVRDVFYRHRVFEEFCTNNHVDDARCGIARTVMWIDYFGNVYPCIQYPTPVGDLKKDNLHTIWYSNEKIDKILQQSLYTNYKKCHFCNLNSYCTPCIAMSVIEKRDDMCNNSSYLQAKITKKYF